MTAVMTRTEDAVARLSASPLGKGAAPDAIMDLAHRAVFVDKLRGETLFVDRHPAETLYLVLRGVLKLCRPLDGGRDVIVEMVGPGDLIGEAALCDGARYTTRAVAVHPSTVMALPRPDLMGFLERDPAAMRNVLSMMTGAVARAEGRVEDLAVFGVRQRIVRLLIRLADWTGRKEGGGVVVPVALSRQEVAELCGTTVETAIRVLSVLRKQGLVEPARRGFVLRDPAGLESFGVRAA